jgi:hypothetical protein
LSRPAATAYQGAGLDFLVGKSRDDVNGESH